MDVKEIAKKEEFGEERIYFKELRLITPEFAQKLHIPAEAPVFISLGITKKKVCSQCGVSYGPLTYYKGGVIKAHHFHESGGGIYSCPSRSLEDFKMSIITPFGWVALLEPIGHRDDYLRVGRSEQAEIKQILAFCCAPSCNTYHPPFKVLEEGLTFVKEAGNYLLPLCGLEKHPEYANRVRFYFKYTEDGEVLFSRT